MPDIHIKRIYEPASPRDGYRVLVDRLWPRGIKKEDASINLWLKEIGPSSELRKWFSHDPEKWKAFRMKYFKELDGKKELIESLIKNAKKQKLTLLYSAKEERFNNAAALKEYIEKIYTKHHLIKKRKMKK
ncbi:MAG: hypothetical protein A2V93_03810 [Ignavibacteria bacterium RBG_16_34_14]|nr:MAG: hypothetical protein A2V93_03810 [Ignavibacteria bacterium RBG_16_34_14]